MTVSFDDISNEVVLMILDCVSPYDLGDFLLVQRCMYPLGNGRLEADKQLYLKYYLRYNRGAVQSDTKRNFKEPANSARREREVRTSRI